MAHTQEKHHDVHEGESLATYWGIYIGLMVLLVLTVAVAEHDLGGSLNIIIAMVIAVIKAILVILFFMHVRHGTKLIWIVVAAGFFWLGIFLVFSFLDYGSGPNNGDRQPGGQSGLVYEPNGSPNSQPEFRNPLRPLLP